MLARLSVCISSRSSLYFRAGSWNSQQIKRFVTRTEVISDFKGYLSGMSGDTSTVIQCLKSCATDLTKETARFRVGLANNIFKKLNEQSIAPSVQMYNTLIQVYLKNHHIFSPSELLQKMKENDVLPNRGTLFLLLDAYSQQGNINGAQKLLQEIQSNEIPVTEELYASLITCHAVSGDMTAAVDLLESMKNSRLAPGIIAYTSLLTGYAYNGELDPVFSTIEQMTQDRMYIGHNVFLDILEALSRGGHFDKIPQVLDVIKNKKLMYKSLVEMLLTFSSQGEIDATLCLLNYLPNMESYNTEKDDLLRTCTTAFRLLAISRPLSDMIECMNIFTDNGLSLNTCFEVLIKIAFDNKDWSDLKQILNEMAAKDIPIKSLYIYPPLVACSRNKDMTNMLDWLKVINDYNIPVDWNMIIMSLTFFDNDVSMFMHFLKNNGFINQWMVQILRYVLFKSNLGGVPSFCNFLKEHLKKEDIPVKELLDAIVILSEVDIDSYCQIFEAIIPACHTDEHFQRLSKIAFFIISHSIGAPRDVIVFVKSLLENTKLQGIELDITNACVLALKEFSKRGRYLEFDELYKLLNSHNVKLECEMHRNALKVTKDPTTAVEAFKTIKASRCPYGSIQYANIISTLVNAKHINQAMLYYKEMNRLRFDVPTITRCDMIKGLLSNGDLSGALYIRSLLGNTPTPVINLFIDAYAARGEVDNCLKEFQFVVTNKKPTWRTYYNLMKCYRYHGDLDKTIEVFEKAKSSNLLQSRMVNTVVDMYLNKEDIEGATRFVCENSVRPTGVTLITLFTEYQKANREDLRDELLSKMVDVFEINKNHAACFDVYAAMRCSNIDKAVNDMKSKKLTPADVLYVARRLEDGHVEDIKLGINLLEHLGMPTHGVYKSLLYGYYNKGDINGLIQIKEKLDKLKKPDKTLDELYRVLTTASSNQFASSPISVA